MVKNLHMEFSGVKMPTRKRYMINLTEKLSDLEFVNDTKALLQTG